MKTTLDLPDDLVRAVKIRAVKENKKLKDAIADLLRRGLAQEHGPKTVVRRRLKLPLVESAYEALLTDDRIAFKEEPAGLEPLWRELAVRGTASPKLWMDAYLAAFALAGRLRMVTTDAAFSSLWCTH